MEQLKQPVKLSKIREEKSQAGAHEVLADGHKHFCMLPSGIFCQRENNPS